MPTGIRGASWDGWLSILAAQKIRGVPGQPAPSVDQSGHPLPGVRAPSRVSVALQLVSQMG